MKNRYIMEELHKKTILFIVGSGRSGSTILDLSIGSHQECFSVGEIVNIHKEFSDNRWCTCGSKYSSCDIWNDLYKCLHRSNIHVDKLINVRFPIGNSFKINNYINNILNILNLTRHGKTSTLANIFIFNEISKVIKETIIVDSSKDIKRAIMLYRNIGFKCKIIHLIRDVRGVAYSGKKTNYSVTLPPDYIKKTYPAKEIRSVENTVQIWNKQNKMIRGILKLFSKKNDYITIRYEDLTQNPVETLRNTCNWLQVDFNEKMINFGDKIHHNIGGNPSRFNSSSVKNNPEQWRTKLTDNELSYCKHHARELLSFYNYE